MQNINFKTSSRDLALIGSINNRVIKYYQNITYGNITIKYNKAMRKLLLTLYNDRLVCKVELEGVLFLAYIGNLKFLLNQALVKVELTFLP